MVESRQTTHPGLPQSNTMTRLTPSVQLDEMMGSPQYTTQTPMYNLPSAMSTSNAPLGSTMGQQEKSMWKKDDFEMGNIVHSKGDREILYLARKKTEFCTIIITIREITKKRLGPNQVYQMQKVATFLNKTKHENLLQVWGLFWDDRKVYYIQEPAIRVAQLFLPSDQEQGNNSPDFISSFRWQKTAYNHQE